MIWWTKKIVSPNIPSVIQEPVQFSVGQILGYLNVFKYMDKYIHLPKYSLIFLGQIILDIYLLSSNPVHLDIHLSIMVTHIFVYLFVSKTGQKIPIFDSE